MQKIDQINLFFDCDGVILNSNYIKTEAFRKTLSNENEYQVEQFIDYHQRNQGVDRFKKFDFFFKKVKQNFNIKDYNQAINKYSDLCRENLKKSKLVNGIKNFLIDANKKNYSCYVISGSEQNELRNILKFKKLDKYFKGIYGSPLTKVENLKKLSYNNPINHKDIFFGDAESDMKAAMSTNIQFIYISEHSDWNEAMSICRKNNFQTYKNFIEVISACII